MPIYEYQCKACGYMFEEIQKVSDEPVKKCPKCKCDVQKLVSKSAFHLKGSGWYVTDYKKKPKKEAETKTETKKEEPKKQEDKKEETNKPKEEKKIDKKD